MFHLDGTTLWLYMVLTGGQRSTERSAWSRRILASGLQGLYHRKYLQVTCPKSYKLITILPSSWALALTSKLGPISPATESISSRGKLEHLSDNFSSGRHGRVVSQLKLVEFCPLPKP